MRVAASGLSGFVGAAFGSEARARGLVTASGGNHGLGVAYAGQRLGCAVRIFLPTSTPAENGTT